MSAIKIIQNPESFRLSSKWEAISQVSDKTVEQNGRSFKVLCEAKLSDAAFRKRRTQALLRIIFSFGLVYLCCSKKIKAMLTQQKKLFISPVAPKPPTVVPTAAPLIPAVSVQPQIEKVAEPIPVIKEVTLEEAEKALNNGLEVPEKIKERLKVINWNDQDIQILSRGQFFITFSFTETPELVLKASNGGDIEKRYQNTVIGKQAQLKYDLNLLEFPDTVYLKDSKVMVESRLPFKDGQHAQEDLYYQNQARLKPIALQLARLIRETGDDDPRVTNYPLFERDGELRCGVIDLEWGGYSADNGFMGGQHNSPGLIGMMPNGDLIDAVIEEGKKLGLTLEQKGAHGRTIKASEKKGTQEWNIARYYQYQEFHKNRKIQTGLEPIMELSELAALGLDLNESWKKEVDEWDEKTQKWARELKTFTLKEAVEDVVNFINRRIEAAKADHLKDKRRVRLPMNSEPFDIYGNLGLDPKKVSFTWEEEQQLWMNRILNALRDKGYIFEYKNLGGMHGFSIKC